MCAQPVWFQSPYLESSGMGCHMSVSGSTCWAEPMHSPGSFWEFGAQPQWTGSSLGSWAREHPDTTIQGDDTICRMRPLSCWWSLGQEYVLERPRRVLQYFCAEQLFRSGGGLTLRQGARGRRSAREPTLLNTY